MSKISRVVVTVTCDQCKVQDEKTEEFPVLNSKGKIVLLDLHPECHVEVYGPGLELADSSAQVPDKGSSKAPHKSPSNRPGDRNCLLCPETRTSNTGILDHMTNDHGLPHSSQEIYGNVCPIDGEEQSGLLSRHVGFQHKEFVHVSQAFEWAKTHGDKHHVVAARITAMKKLAKAA